MKADPKRVADLLGNPWLCWLDRYFLLLQLILAAVIFFCTTAIADTYSAVAMVIWAIPVRIVAVLHSTWLTNSAAHLWGYRCFETDNNSHNNWWVALITFGEGWHNNHHAYPSSARHGFKTWELDLSWWFILILQRLGLVWDVKLPPVDASKS